MGKLTYICLTKIFPSAPELASHPKSLIPLGPTLSPDAGAQLMEYTLPSCPSKTAAHSNLGSPGPGRRRHKRIVESSEPDAR